MIALAVPNIPVKAEADIKETYLDKKGLEQFGINIDKNGNVVIPEIVTDSSGNQYRIIGIENDTFSGNMNLKSVEFPKSLRSIGVYAFSSSGLESIILNGENLNISSRAFTNCKNLRSVLSNAENLIIGFYAFESCSNLIQFEANSNISIINSGAFRYTNLHKFGYKGTWYLDAGDAYTELPKQGVGMSGAAFVDTSFGWNHNWEPETSATCQKKATEKCSVCSATREVGSLAAHSYTGKTKVTQTQSCTNPEITRYYCKWCDDYEDKQTKAAKGHDYYVSANATIKHGTQHTCRTCGTSYYDNDRLKSKLSFNATVNGGTTSESNQECNADSSVSLTGKTACKDGWEFVGWNTDKSAKEAMPSITMDSNKTVYAIFKKDLTVNFVDG